MSPAKIYVGNLALNTTDETLRQALYYYGQVLDSIVMRDRDTGKSCLVMKRQNFWLCNVAYQFQKAYLPTFFLMPKTI
jgi:hypothetical protein